MNKLKMLVAGLTLVSGSAFATQVTLYKSPTCGCCTEWANHIKAEGFEVKVVHQQSNVKLRNKFGISRELTSCHTAVVEGYVIEGHVPVQDIKRLLKEKPKVAGLSVPGMPASSPGMDVPGNTDAYQVVAFTKEGRKYIYNQYNMD